MASLTDPGAQAPSLGRALDRRDATSPNPDATLMASLMRKEPAAAAALYARYASRIYGLGLVLLKNRADAEDLVQDTFLKVWRMGSAFDPRRGSLDTWILLIGRNLAIDLVRRRTVEDKRRSSEPRRSEASDEPGPEWYAELKDSARRVRQAMDRLPRGQRTALELAYLGEHSSAQVAELENVPLGTAKSRIRTGIEALRRILSEKEAETTGREGGRARAESVRA
jgi:RNA polymerase sigma-70 factor (ECF subfamily)